ncbi:uncharacterized protein LOC112562600 isoform X2 [Pomacea canaliculata]|nr:uncharacterized protein LOC112562600 isoform X2 [Pomacea canaliculata]
MMSSTPSPTINHPPNPPNPPKPQKPETETSNPTHNSSVTVAVLICLAVLFVVVAVVAVFFWRRKRQADDVRKEHNPICLSAATNLHRRQDSFHVYDKLSYDNKRANINNASTAADNDNNDDYTYIDDPTINKDVVRLHHDRPVTTDGEHALTDPSVSGLEPDLSTTYTLARPIDNDIPGPQPPDYFSLEEREKKVCGEPAQYFTLEEKGEKNSAADTDTQQYFILEKRQEGEGGESVSKHMSSRSEVDYFVLEKDDGQELDCADVTSSDTSRDSSEEAEYCRLDPNSCLESDYTPLTRPPQPPDARGDNPYCLASHPE